MAHVVVLGAGLGGTILASELREKLGRQHSISVVTKGSSFRFVPSNPWVAVGWRRQADVEVDLTRIFAQTGIALHPQGAARLHPAERRIELGDGASLAYDYLVIATGPELAFDEIRTEYVGWNATHGPLAGPPAPDIPEVELRVAVKSEDKAPVERFCS